MDDTDIYQWRVYIVGAIDVLNQGDELMVVEKCLDNGGDTAGTPICLRKVLALRMITKKYEDELNRLVLEAHVKQTGSSNGVRNYFKTQWFSDTLFLYSPWLESDGTVAISHAYAVLIYFSRILLYSFAQGLAIRGAIERSWAIDLTKDKGKGDLYGPVLARLDHLERDVAKHARIVVGNRLYDWLFAPAQDGNSEANACRSLIEIDRDGVPYVHFLGETLRCLKQDELVTENTTGREAVRLGLNFVATQRSNFAKRQNQTLAWRYSILEDYFLSHAPKWGVGT